MNIETLLIHAGEEEKNTVERSRFPYFRVQHLHIAAKPNTTI